MMKEYTKIDNKLKELNNMKEEIELSLDGEKSLPNRIKNFRNAFDTNEKNG